MFFEYSGNITSWLLLLSYHILLTQKELFHQELFRKFYFHFAIWVCCVASGGMGGVKITPLVFSWSACPVHFKLGKYLTHDKYFQKNQTGTLGPVAFSMTSSYFVKFSKILMKFQFEITFDVKNYFLLLLRFLKENLLEISNK